MEKAEELQESKLIAIEASLFGAHGVGMMDRDMDFRKAAVKLLMSLEILDESYKK